MIVAIVYVIQTTTPIETHYNSVQVNETSKRVLFEWEVWKSIDRYLIVKDICEIRQIMKRKSLINFNNLKKDRDYE